jgi:hypothetical protein
MLCASEVLLWAEPELSFEHCGAWPKGLNLVPGRVLRDDTQKRAETGYQCWFCEIIS